MDNCSLVNADLRYLGNLPSFISEDKKVYATKFGTGIVKNGTIFNGECRIENITFYLYSDGFLATYRHPVSRVETNMVLGEEVKLYKKSTTYKLTVSQILTTMYRNRCNSYYVNMFKNAVCNTLKSYFILTSFQEKLITMIKVSTFN